jgi:hypothetical protein
MNNQKIEIPRDFLVVVDGFITAMASNFHLINSGKRSAALDQVSAELRDHLATPAKEYVAFECEGRMWIIEEGQNADKWRKQGFELHSVKPAQQQRSPVPWSVLIEAVSDVTGSTCDLDPSHHIGHQMTGINFNSLARIVDKFSNPATGENVTPCASGQHQQPLANDGEKP